MSDLIPSTPPPGGEFLFYGSDGGAPRIASIADLLSHAFELRSSGRYALHPIETALSYHRAAAEIPGGEGHGGCGFEWAERLYRAGTQGLPLSEIPQLAENIRELSRAAAVDRAGRKALRQWVEEHGPLVDENAFSKDWLAQLMHSGVRDDGYFAYLHPLSGVLAHDLHDENVVRMPKSDDLAVIDPYISLARRGTWAAIKLAEIGYPPPADDLHD